MRFPALLPLLLALLSPARAEPPKREAAVVAGYVDGVSHDPGEALALRAHALHGAFTWDVFRVGADERPLALQADVPAVPRLIPPEGFRTGAGWPVTCTIPLSRDWPSGLYAVKLADPRARSAFYVPFVLRGPPGPPVVVMANTFTWQAYNPWGGGSFYKGEEPREPEAGFETLVSLARPDLAASTDSPKGHTGYAEKPIHRFLQARRIPYRQIADQDLHGDPAALAACKVFVITTHAEYWSREMVDRLEAFLAAGGSVLNLSGNVLWWKVTLRGDQLECRKDRGLHAQTGERGGLWKELGVPSRPLLGVQSDPRGLHTYAPFRVLAPGHWLLARRGLTRGALLAAHGENRGGGSGGETDKAGPGTPPGAVLLAHGLNPGDGGGDIVFFETPAGGAVLSAGSISVAGCLETDATLADMVDRFLVRYAGVTPRPSAYRPIRSPDAAPFH